jgi:hypothetical protein
MKGFERWRFWRAEVAGDEEPSDPELARLLARSRALPRDEEPARDLWSGIENRIRERAAEPEPPGGSLVTLFPRPVAAAALAVLLVGTTVLTTWWVAQQPPAPLGDAEVSAIAERLRQRDGVADVHQSLVAILDARRAELPPETVEALEENLRSIDRAMAEIHLALESNPDHHSLSFLLAEAYRREADLLERLEWWMRSSDEVRS